VHICAWHQALINTVVVPPPRPHLLHQELYKNPEDLSPLQDNPRARMLAHSMIQQAMLEKQLDTYRACTDTAKQLANVIESGQRTGASTLLGALRKLLPVPFLR
jgi:hypothetical protein